MSKLKLLPTNKNEKYSICLIITKKIVFSHVKADNLPITFIPDYISYNVILTLGRCEKRRKCKIPGLSLLPRSHRHCVISTSSDNRSSHEITKTWTTFTGCRALQRRVSSAKNALQARGEVHDQVQPDRTWYVVTALIPLTNFGDQTLLQITFGRFVYVYLPCVER